jgi:hypothetical protein
VYWCSGFSWSLSAPSPNSQCHATIRPSSVDSSTNFTLSRRVAGDGVKLKSAVGALLMMVNSSVTNSWNAPAGSVALALTRKVSPPRPLRWCSIRRSRCWQALSRAHATSRHRESSQIDQELIFIIIRVRRRPCDLVIPCSSSPPSGAVIATLGAALTLSVTGMVANGR